MTDEEKRSTTCGDPGPKSVVVYIFPISEVMAKTRAPRHGSFCTEHSTKNAIAVVRRIRLQGGVFTNSS